MLLKPQLWVYLLFFSSPRGAKNGLTYVNPAQKTLELECCLAWAQAKVTIHLYFSNSKQNLSEILVEVV